MSPYQDFRVFNIKPRLKQLSFGFYEDSCQCRIRPALQIQWAELSDTLLLGEQATGSNEV